jgi:O-antigen/teichoic acid export membrane protein/aminoglycoside phosphotransferase (APT) family kinase protein
MEMSMPRLVHGTPHGTELRLPGLPSGWRAPLHRDGLAIVASSGLSSAVGLLYWVLAARLFPPEVVGVNAVALSTMMLIGGVAHLNMTYALLRFVPVAGRAARRLVAVGYLVAVTIAALAGAGFALGAGAWAPELVEAAGQGPLIAFFAIAAPVWTLFTLQDYVLTAVGRATVVPAENILFALLKIGLLVVAAFAAVSGGIALSWVAATAVIVLLINLWLLLRVLPAHGRARADRAVPVTVGGVARFVRADFAGALFQQAAMMGLPMVVLARLGPQAAAVYNVVWQFGLALYLVPSGMGQSLVAHGAADPGRVEKARRETVRRALLLVVPAAVALVLGGRLVLWVFGEHYADAGALALALIALSAVPNVITAATTSTARVRQRRGVQFGVPAAVSVLAISVSWVLMPRLGIVAVGLAWLLAQCLVAGVVLVVKAPWLPTPLARPIDAVRTAALLRRIGPGAIRQAGGRGTDTWRIGEALAGGSESVVVTVGPPDGPRALLKASDTSRGRAGLRRQTEALAALHADPRIRHWTPLIPRPLGAAEIGDSYCVTESLLSGDPGPRALADPARRARFVSSAVDTISELHRCTAAVRPAGDGELDHWVHGPMAAVVPALPAGLRAEAELLAGELDARLRGRAVPVGWTHGDYLPVNLLTGPDERISAVVDWCTADELGMPVLDVALFLQVAQATAEGEELGTLVVRWVADMPGREADVLERCQAALGASVIEPEVLVLLGWLQHVNHCVSASPRTAANPVWNRRNLRAVVRQAAGLLPARRVPAARSPDA